MIKNYLIYICYLKSSFFKDWKSSLNFLKNFKKKEKINFLNKKQDFENFENLDYEKNCKLMDEWENKFL